jgi:membrane protein
MAKTGTRDGRAPWAVVKRVTAEFFADSIPTVAGGITFFVLLALFPAVGSLVSLYGLVADRHDVARNLDSVSAWLPEGAVTVLGAELKRLIAQPPATLSLGFLASTAIALWSASGGFKALVEGLNVAFEVRETRSFLRLSIHGIVFTLAGLGFAVVAIALGVVLPGLGDVLRLGPILTPILQIAVWPLSFVFCALVLAVIYRFGPDRENPQWRWISWGSSIATLLWLAGTRVFSWYAYNYGSYNQVYGAAGELVGFLVWVWLSIMIILLGAEINSELELPVHR